MAQLKRLDVRTWEVSLEDAAEALPGGCVVLDEDQKVIYTWAGMPDQLPDVTEIQAALGIGKVNFE